MMTRYPNRRAAGKILAESLRSYANHKDVIVLGLPRGGVPVAYEIAAALNVPLDVFIVRKLGVPGHSELAMGAIAMGDAQVFNPDIIRSLSVTKEEINFVIAHEEEELKRRELKYRGHRPFPDLTKMIVILVDDGIATGATMRAAIKSLQQLKPKKLIIAVPVAAQDTCEELRSQVDELICPLQPTDLHAVGVWYEDFAQTEDEEVYELLRE